MQKGKTSISILIASLKAACVERGKKLHASAIKNGVALNIYVANSLIVMYAKFGRMADARCIFDRIPYHNVVLWNVLILGYAQNGEGGVALQLFENMQWMGYTPLARTFVAALIACTCLAAKESGKQIGAGFVKTVALQRGIGIHSQAASCGYDSNIFVASTLVDMYAKCGSIEGARKVFERMPYHDTVSWNALITGYVQNEEGEVVLDLIACMQTEGCAPNARTFVTALMACIILGAKEGGKQVYGKFVKVNALEKGMAIHSQAVKDGSDSDITVANTLIDMYSKCGSMRNAHDVFDRMMYHDVVSWTVLMLGYVQSGEPEFAMQLFSHMLGDSCEPVPATFVAALMACTSLCTREEGKQVNGRLLKTGSLQKGLAIHSQAAKYNYDSDIFVASAVVDMYAKCGSMVHARGVFDRLPCHNSILWNVLLSGYAQNGEGEVVLQLFGEMQCKGYMPDARTFIAALMACGNLAANEVGKQVRGKLLKVGALDRAMNIHSQAVKGSCSLDTFMASAFIDTYAKCGSMEHAQGVFDRMLCPDLVSWTALIMGYADNGEGEAGLRLFAQMRFTGCAPDARTFVAALKACGNVAALENGKTIHGDICRYGLESDPVVANSLVDFYAKCGCMIDAHEVFNSISKKDTMTWNILITGYSRIGNIIRVFDLFDRMQDDGIHPNGITFISILTMCSHAGLVDKGKEYFQLMYSKYGINPDIDHYSCMVDLLGRANQLDDAVAMIKTMPLKPDAVIWFTILGACQKWKNVVLARLAFESLLVLDANQPAAYALMANIYGSVGMN